tara:strand:- start:79 stop:345 length:267 start_codon:yes stop_codon:yes gene_type:complete
MITVNKIDENTFSVKVSEGDSSTEHEVNLEDNYYIQLTDRKIPKELLIEKSFEFLLEREPKESILSNFDLKVISVYFSDYEHKIKDYF